MAKTLATQRTLKLFRDEGWQCAIVEKWLPARGKMKFGVRQDVWGFGDILASRMRKYKTCLACFGLGHTVADRQECKGCHGSGKQIEHEERIALIQCFPDRGGTGFADHRAKVLEIPQATEWLRAGGKIYLVGWRPKTKTDRGPGNWRWKQEEIVISA